MAKPKNFRLIGSIGTPLPSGSYRYRYTGVSGLPTSETFKTLKLAQERQLEISLQRSKGFEVDAEPGKQTLASYAADWIENRPKLKPRSRQGYRDLLRLHIAPTIGRLKVKEVTVSKVNAWFTALEKTGALRTPSRSYQLLKSVMHTAYLDGLVSKNPCQIAGGGAAHPEERPYMTPEHFDQMLGAMPEWVRIVFEVAYNSHVRKGELVGYQRGDFDPQTGTINVSRQVVSEGRDGPVIATTKKNDQRHIILPPSTVTALVQHLSVHPNLAPDSPMFCRPDGTPITRRTIDYYWERARRATGLTQYKVHDIRHAGLSAWGMSGADRATLKQRGGHKSDSSAARYAHTVDSYQRELAARLDRARTLGLG